MAVDVPGQNSEKFLGDIRGPYDIVSVPESVVHRPDFCPFKQMMDTEEVRTAEPPCLSPACLFQQIGKEMTDIVAAVGKSGQGQCLASLF